MTTSKTYSVSEVSSWERDGIVEVPALQRGLVWEPHQVELLWDSILRGFPIGAFAFTPVRGNEVQHVKVEGNRKFEDRPDGVDETNREIGDNKEHPSAQYFLLDGQQRYNAIKAAFSPWSDDAKSVLWIDFMPQPNTGSTRRFWIKVTTKAHPWGFANNDTCSTLGWTVYREALNRFTGSQETRIQDVRMSDAWPIKARCPVPFESVLEIFKDSERISDKDAAYEFCAGIVAWCKTHEAVGVETKEKDFNLVARTSKTLFEALCRMRGYPIVVNILEPETLDARDVIGEEELTDDGTNNLEQLFTRINTLGTPISPYDLRYSAIKAYWGNIKIANDDIAGTIMPAANLAIFAFRLALTLAYGRKGFADTPSVQRIRLLKFNGDEESKAACRIVDELYANGGAHLRCIIRDVESALHVFNREGGPEDGLPAVIRTSIVLNSPDVYLLLLYIAYKGRLENFGNLAGLATWLHWFSVEQQKKIVDEIKTAVDEGNLDSLRRLLSSLCERKALMQPIEPSDDNFLSPDKFLKDGETVCDWQPYENEVWYPLFDAIWFQRELVIFATRRYFNREFRYDPAETKFLTGHNRPWDMDHIIPKSWVSRQGVSMGEYQAVCREWIGSNGNFAAIPFTLNRRKGNREDWGYYHLDPERMQNLFFNEHFLNLESDTMTSSKSMAMSFIRTAHARMIAMYKEWRISVVGYLLEEEFE